MLSVFCFFSRKRCLIKHRFGFIYERSLVQGTMEKTTEPLENSTNTKEAYAKSINKISISLFVFALRMKYLGEVIGIATQEILLDIKGERFWNEIEKYFEKIVKRHKCGKIGEENDVEFQHFEKSSSRKSNCEHYYDYSRE